MSTLICHGLDVDAVNEDGNTALHLASRHGTTAVLQRLTEAFPNEEIKNHRGFTALDEAILAGRTRCTTYIRRFAGHDKAQALEKHCSIERLRLETLRRNKVRPRFLKVQQQCILCATAALLIVELSFVLHCCLYKYDCLIFKHDVSGHLMDFLAWYTLIFLKSAVRV